MNGLGREKKAKSEKSKVDEWKRRRKRGTNEAGGGGRGGGEPVNAREKKAIERDH